MHYLKTILSLIAVICISACNNASEPVKSEQLAKGQPSLWKVTGTKPNQVGSAYMFGTIHILPKNINWRTPVLETAIAESDELLIEVLGLEDTKNAAKIFRKLAISPDQPEIETRIKPSLRDELEEVVDKSNIPEFALNKMESWAVALSLASAQTTGLGLSAEEGVEKKLITQFNKAKKPIEGLETIEQQLGYFDQLPETQQRLLLTSVVEEAGETREAYQELFNAWITGDAADLVARTTSGILQDPKIRDKILIARNLDWADQVDQKLQKPGIIFVAVGAAHLVGPDAVQAMLVKRGYKIEKIQ